MPQEHEVHTQRPRALANPGVLKGFQVPGFFRTQGDAKISQVWLG